MHAFKSRFEYTCITSIAIDRIVHESCMLSFLAHFAAPLRRFLHGRQGRHGKE